MVCMRAPAHTLMEQDHMVRGWQVVAMTGEHRFTVPRWWPGWEA